MSLDTIIITGRLGSDPKIDTTRNGAEYITFPLAVSVDHGAKGKTVWYRCMMWSSCRSYDYVLRFKSKGDLARVVGTNLVPFIYTLKKTGEKAAGLSLNVLEVSSPTPPKKRTNSSSDEYQAAHHVSSEP